MGIRFQAHSIPHSCEIKGDGRFLSIAAASILAKTHRDELMLELVSSISNVCVGKQQGLPHQGTQIGALDTRDLPPPPEDIQVVSSNDSQSGCCKLKNWRLSKAARGWRPHYPGPCYQSVNQNIGLQIQENTALILRLIIL